MPTRPTSPDPSGSSSTEAGANPFASLGAGLGAGLDFFQDWIKAAGSALPHLQGAASAGAGMPAWSMPTLDPAELEKRIQDLKTVQFWLEQNARMIAMTIQGLEVQRMTLSTLKGMNVSMDNLRESLKARPSPAPAPKPAPPVASPAPHRFDADEGLGSDDGPAGTSAADDTDKAPEGAELINPMRWWDTLTQQFTHLASQAAQTVGDSVGESMDMIKQAQAQAAAGLAGTAPSVTPGAAKGPAKRSSTGATQAAGKANARATRKRAARPTSSTTGRGRAAKPDAP